MHIDICVNFKLSSTCHKLNIYLSILIVNYFGIVYFQYLGNSGIHHDDHNSEGSAETIGSDSGRGCSEEDDMFSTPSGGKFVIMVT